MTSFDQRAADWDSDPLKVERARWVAQAIRESLPLKTSMTALEVGCGTGLLSFALQPSLGAITLADNSVGMLEVLKGKIAASGLVNMTPLRLDLSADPLPKTRYDLLYTLMVLHHIPDTSKVLGDFYTLLKHPGFLCISDLDKEDGSFHKAREEVHHGFDRQELTRQLAQAGFVNIRFSTVYEIIKEVDGRPKAFPLFLAVAEK
jgi:ubiquinone/menaquinone biosynthesis C-methylase UbiE